MICFCIFKAEFPDPMIRILSLNNALSVIQGNKNRHKNAA